LEKFTAAEGRSSRTGAIRPILKVVISVCIYCTLLLLAGSQTTSSIQSQHSNRFLHLAGTVTCRIPTTCRLWQLTMWYERTLCCRRMSVC